MLLARKSMSFLLLTHHASAYLAVITMMCSSFSLGGYF